MKTLPIVGLLSCHAVLVSLIFSLFHSIAFRWVVPFEIFFVIGLFDYYGVTGVWVKHYWRTPGMAW
jgi:hypothetical protein